MVSNLKSETARINGAKSRGPTTDEGKAKSSRNALKHGLTAGSGNILLDCEDPDQFDETLNKLLGIHEPATPAEKDIVEEMFAARWRIRRMWTIETGLLNTEILTQAAKTDTPDPDIHLSMAFRALSDDSRSLALANRYEARLQRTYDRAYKTLRELQQARKSEPPKQPHTFVLQWFDPEKEPDPSTHNPSVSEGESSESAQPAPTGAANPTEPRASASGPSSILRNEPIGAVTKEVRNEPTPAQPPSSNPGVVTTPARPHNGPIEAGELQ